MATIDFKRVWIDSFKPFREHWNPDTYEYWKTLRGDKPISCIPLSERIQKIIHILKKEGITDLYYPRNGNDGGYYYTYHGIAVMLNQVTPQVLKRIAPLADRLYALRLDSCEGSVLQIMFEYKIMHCKSFNAVCSCDLKVRPYYFPSWMKAVKWAEKLNILKTRKDDRNCN